MQTDTDLRMTPEQCAALVVSRLQMRTANALLHAVLALIADGVFPTGTRLPTVRAMAQLSGMSKSSVGQAWTAMAERRAVVARGPAGTFVVGPPQAPRAERFQVLTSDGCTAILDLASLRGDELPRPSLSAAFQAAANHPTVNYPYSEPICPELVRAVAPRWPGQPESWLALHGMPDLLELFCSIMIRPRDHVIVEAPTYPRVLDIIEHLGGVPEPVPWRKEGLDLAALAKVMAVAPVAMIVQPSVQVPLGRSFSPEWIQEAAPILSKADFPILEVSLLDCFAPEPRSLASVLPQRVLRGESAVYAYGSDLKVATCAGSSLIMDRLLRRLSYSSRGVSRVNQLALAHLLTDDEALRLQDLAVRETVLRRQQLAQSLVENGMSPRTGRGPGIWLPVPDETAFLSALRADQMSAAAGSCMVPRGWRPSDGVPHVLLNAGVVAPVDAPGVAHRLARASTAG